MEGKLEADSGVDIEHKNDEQRHRRELRLESGGLLSCRDYSERLRNGRVKTVRTHVVQVDPRNVPDPQRRAQPVNLNLLSVRRLPDFSVSPDLFQKTVH